MLRHVRLSKLNKKALIYCLKPFSSSTTCQAINMSTANEPPEVLFQTVISPNSRGSYRLMTLNKPKVLNALNLNMIHLLTNDIKATMDDGSVDFIVVRGGDKAFCAGGDIRSITEAGRIGAPLSREFFCHEYQLDYLTGTINKPYVAIIDGITMGGGVGISVHSPYRVATQTTTFAMPETAIGLFPDVGGGYFLPRLQGQLGMFLSLTGQRLKGRDVLHAGIATHFIDREKIPLLLDELSSACDITDIKKDSHGVVKNVLDNLHDQCLHVDSKEFSLAQYMDKINNCFQHDTVEQILTALEEDGTEWALKQIHILNKMSPTSLKVTHRQVMEGKHRSFEECLMVEYRLSQRCIAGKDFYEGVRAVLVDKDNAPKWDPATLAEVTPDIVDSYFSPLEASDELHVKPISKL